jgi:hypothetical protein
MPDSSIHPRSPDDIADAAAEAVNAPADSNEAEAFRAAVIACCNKLRDAPYKHVRKRELEAALENYATALRVARARAEAVKEAFYLPKITIFGQSTDDHLTDINFIDLLDDQTKQVEEMRKFAHVLSKQKGARPKDPVATAVVHMAHRLITRHCPWLGKPTLTPNGPWLSLSSLLYEALTGEVDRDLSWYCREYQSGAAELSHPAFQDY